MSETLKGRIAEAKRRLVQLRAADARRTRGVKCRLTEHETVCYQVVCGGGVGDDLKRHGLPEWGGYQVHKCLACGTWLVTDYSHNHPHIVSAKTARALADI